MKAAAALVSVAIVGTCGCTGRADHHSRADPTTATSSAADARPIDVLPPARLAGENDVSYFIRRTCGYERVAYTNARPDSFATMRVDPGVGVCDLSSPRGTLIIKIIVTAPQEYFSSLAPHALRQITLATRPAVELSSGRVVVLGTTHAYDVQFDGETPSGRHGEQVMLDLAQFVVQTEHDDNGLIFVAIR